MFSNPIFNRLALRALYLFAVIFISGVGITTYQNPTQFALFYVTCLATSVIYFWSDKNVVTVLLLMGLFWVIPVTCWYLADDSWTIKLITYLSAAFTCYYARENRSTICLATALFLSGFAEIFWFTTEFTAPAIYWSIHLITVSTLFYKALYLRWPITKALFNKRPSQLILDVKISKILLIDMLLQTLNVVEYLTRHLLLVDIDLIYKLLPIFSQALSCLMVWVIFTHYYEQRKKRLLIA